MADIVKDPSKRHPGFPPGKSGNPGGQPSIKKDLERAATVGIPAEVLATIDEWLEDGEERLKELGADGFLRGLRRAIDEAGRREVLTPADARAMWWRTVLPIAFAGPKKDNDRNWAYAHETVGVRLLGKPKEHVVVEGSESRPIDWRAVPEERREFLLAAITELQAYIDAPVTEH